MMLDPHFMRSMILVLTSKRPDPVSQPRLAGCVELQVNLRQAGVPRAHEGARQIQPLRDHRQGTQQI